MRGHKNRSIISSKKCSFDEEVQKNKELFNQLLRLKAEFENFRKRTEKNKENYIKFAEEGLIQQLLPVMDNLERAIHSAHNHKDFDSFKQGVIMIQKQLKEILVKSGVADIKAVGEKFDPQKHEIVSEEEDDGHPEETIVEELQKGYTLAGKVIRPAMVKVSKSKK